MNAQQRRVRRREQRAALGVAPTMTIRPEVVSLERVELAVATSDMERSIRRRNTAAVAVGVAAGAAIVGTLYLLLVVLL
jgi:hypothetical protein